MVIIVIYTSKNPTFSQCKLLQYRKSALTLLLCTLNDFFSFYIGKSKFILLLLFLKSLTEMKTPTEPNFFSSESGIKKSHRHVKTYQMSVDWIECKRLIVLFDGFSFSARDFHPGSFHVGYIVMGNEVFKNFHLYFFCIATVKCSFLHVYIKFCC